YRRSHRHSSRDTRRVHLARAPVASPYMLVIDEPTSDLYHVARRTCHQLVRDIAARGTTITILTHHDEEIIPEIQNVILLKEGKAVFNGPKNDVLTSQKLSAVYEHPLQLSSGPNGYRVELETTLDTYQT